MMNRFKGTLFTLLVVLCCQSAVVQAQDSSGDWDHTLIVYLLGPNLDGTVGIGPVDSDIELDPGSVFENLDMGFLGGWIAEKDKWGYLVDIVYMDLSADFEFPGGRIGGELGNKQLISNIAGLYRLADHWQLLGGVVYNDLTLKLKLEGPLPPEPRRSRRSESWADPMVGLRYRRPLSERWSFAGFGFVGGGVNADLTWSLNGQFDFAMTERTSLMLGYRYLDFDYEDGQGQNRFKFDMAEHGFAAGFSFHF